MTLKEYYGTIENEKSVIYTKNELNFFTQILNRLSKVERFEEKRTMKKRILAMALAIMMLVMIPAETAMAMPAAFNHDAAVITLAEESAEEAVVEDETTPEENEETTETEEVVEEPTAEPEMTEEPTEEPVATEEPTEEATEEPVVEPEATAEPTEAPAEEPEVTEEPTVEATEEPVVEPEATEEPTGEATEEPTEEPTETPEVTLPEKQDVKFDGRDLTAKVVGSDGVQYDNVEYLSLHAVNSLPSEGVDEYMKLCDDIANMQNTSQGIESAIFSVDKNGNLSFLIKVPSSILYSEEIRGQFIQGFAEEAVAEPEEETANEVPALEEAAEVVVEETNDVPVFISENVELLQANMLPEEVVGVVDEVVNDTKIADADYFKSQLGGNAKGVYNSAYKQVVKGGKNSFTHSAGYLSTYDFVDGLSALNLTYPNSFNFMKPGGSTSFRGTYSYSSHKYNYTVTIEKSAYYNSTIEAQAKAKVDTLVAAAEASATKNYPGNHVYGVIRYLDNWIRVNNYYNNDGTYYSKKDTDVYYYCHSCYGILLKGYGVCESYAMAMTRLLDAAGIRNVYVTGDAGGGHAWNYVQMPNGKWYMLDTTWNDGSSSDAYFLIGSTQDGGEHKAQGRMYTVGKTFKFYALSKANYVANTEKTYLDKVTISKSLVSMKPGETLQLKINKPSASNYYYSKYAKSWTSSNANVAKVSSTGKITAVAPGSATITYTIDGLKRTCTVWVYQFMGNKFTDNNNASYTYTYLSADTAFDSKDVFKKNITVTQKNGVNTAAQIQAGMKLKAPTVKSSNTKIATATAALSGNTIVLTVTPKKVGTATITVSFAGKTSTLKLTNKYNIATNAGWFDYSKIVNQTYKGTAYKPAVKKTATAPANLKYTVSYKNNINAGTATVTIKGTGNYAGTITKNFTIAPKNLTTCKFTASTKYKTYKGKAQKAVTTVKDGKTTLKAGTNYVVQYYVNKAWTTTAPTNVGTYNVRIVGSGNYTGTVAAPNNFEIKQIPLSKVTISCPKEVKWKSGKPVTPPVKVKIGSNTLTAGTDFAIGYYKITKNSAGAEVRTAVSASALCDKGNYVAVITKTKNSVNINWGTKLTVEKKFTIKKM